MRVMSESNNFPRCGNGPSLDSKAIENQIPFKERDWGAVTIDAAIAAMSAMIGHPKSTEWTAAEIAHDARQHAHALVGELVGILGKTMFGIIGEPDYINELGTKFWKHQGLTEACQTPDHNGVTLPTARVWIVEPPKGGKAYLLTIGSDPAYETKRFEDMAARIDITKAAVCFDKSNKKASRAKKTKKPKTDELERRLERRLS